MSHVDEGTLHAVLDGALDAVLPAEEAARVRAHLEACAACAARLEEERAARDEAAQLLGLAAPPPMEPPSFEEVRSLAAARSRAGGASRRLWQMGWAASLVLAVGAGWLLRGASVPLVVHEDTFTPQEKSVRAEAPIPPASVPADEDVAVETPAPDQGSGAAAREEAPSSPPAPAPQVASAEEKTAPTAASLQVGEVRLDTLAFPRSLSEARAATREPAGQPSSSVLPSLTGQAPSYLKSAPGVADAVASRAAADPAAGARSVVTGASLMEPLKEAEAASDVRGAPSLAVPGLQVVSVTALDAQGISGGVMVVQRDVDGTAVQVIHLPASVDPSSLIPLQQGWSQVVRRRDDGWLVLRGAAARSHLTELLGRIDGGG